MPRKEKAPKRIWDNNKEIGSVLISEKTKVIFCCSIRDGIRYVHMRQWYLPKSGIWMPSFNSLCVATNPCTKEGVALPYPMDDFVKLFTQTACEVEQMELFDEANAVYAKVKE